jgi:hypothetical protein
MDSFARVRPPCAGLSGADGMGLLGSHTFMRTLLRWLSGILFCAALLALAFLVVPELWIGPRPFQMHERSGASALILAGFSFLCLLLSRKARGSELLKGFLLGTAFVLWGTESFLPAGATRDAIDAVVIAIFVLDLGLVIKDGLRNGSTTAP